MTHCWVLRQHPCGCGSLVRVCLSPNRSLWWVGGLGEQVSGLVFENCIVDASILSFGVLNNLTVV